jgi:hypothetical protein
MVRSTFRHPIPAMCSPKVLSIPGRRAERKIRRDVTNFLQIANTLMTTVTALSTNLSSDSTGFSAKPTFNDCCLVFCSLIPRRVDAIEVNGLALSPSRFL